MEPLNTSQTERTPAGVTMSHR